MARLGFLVNFHDDADRLRRSLGSLRRVYADAPLLVRDDHSSAGQRTQLEAITSQDPNVILLPRDAVHTGWASYWLVWYELQAFRKAQRELGVDILFKMDTDTVVCGGDHEEIQELGGDIIGNCTRIEPATAAHRLLWNRRVQDCSVYGGGYFIRLGDVVNRMIDAWATIPTEYRESGGTFHEDQSMSLLCWLCDGKVRHERRLERVLFRTSIEAAKAGDFAVHPVKTQEEYDRLFPDADTVQTKARIRSASPHGTRGVPR
jgi:hypothetical protein